MKAKLHKQMCKIKFRGQIELGNSVGWVPELPTKKAGPCCTWTPEAPKQELGTLLNQPR